MGRSTWGWAGSTAGRVHQQVINDVRVMFSYRLHLKTNFIVPVTSPFTVNTSIAKTGKYSCRFSLLKHRETASIAGYVYLAPAVQSNSYHIPSLELVVA